jgi:Na+/melibiose symporter-like transporter
MKEKIAIISAITAFILGWGLTIAGFIVPPLGDISNSVLFVLGQALVYAASVFGITGYFNAETVKLRHDMDKHLEHMEQMRLKEKVIDKGLNEEIDIEKEEDE